MEIRVSEKSVWKYVKCYLKIENYCLEHSPNTPLITLKIVIIQQMNQNHIQQSKSY